MTYSTTITQKGQITIPKLMRDFLRLDTGRRISLELEKTRKKIVITAPEDFLAFTRTIKVKKNKAVDPVKAREYMETHYYERV